MLTQKSHWRRNPCKPFILNGTHEVQLFPHTIHSLQERLWPRDPCLTDFTPQCGRAQGQCPAEPPDDGDGPAPQQSLEKAVPGTVAHLTHRGMVCVFNTAQLQMAHGSDTFTGAQNTVASQTLSTTRQRRHSHSTAINIVSRSRSHSDLL